MNESIQALVVAEDGADLRVAGLVHLERWVLTLLAAGISRVVVKTPDPDKARSRIRDSAFDQGRLDLVRAGSKEEADALCRIASGGKPFLLTHTALAFDSAGFRRWLARATRESDDRSSVIVATTTGTPPDHELAVPVRSSAVVREALPSYTLGLALLPPGYATRFTGGPAAVAGAFRESLATAVAEDCLATCDAAPGFSALLLSDAHKRRAERALIRAAGKESDGWVARHLNRRFSGALTRLLLMTPVTPNLITGFTLATGLTAGWALVQGSRAGFLIGTLLYQLNSMIDGCDGEIARLKFLASRFGEWADSVSDQVGNFSFVVGVPIGLARAHRGDVRFLWLGALVLAGWLVLLPAAFLRLRRVSDAANLNDFGRSLVRGFSPGSWRGRAMSFLSTIVRRDFYALFFFLLALAGREEAILVLLALGTAGHFPTLLLRPKAAAQS